MSSPGLCEVDAEMRRGRGVLRPALNIVRALPGTLTSGHPDGTGGMGCPSVVSLRGPFPSWRDCVDVLVSLDAFVSHHTAMTARSTPAWSNAIAVPCRIT